jgi:uncharacterized membrane protein
MPVKQEKYSVTIQMALALIPFVNFWAAYRIEKLRLMLLFFVPMVFLNYLVIIDLMDQLVMAYPIFGGWIGVITSIPEILLIRYFTIKWNEKQFKIQKESKITGIGIFLLWESFLIFLYGFNLDTDLNFWIIGSIPLFLLGVALLAVGLLKKSDVVQVKENSSLEILKKRYAGGEISEEEFNKIKEGLE